VGVCVSIRVCLCTRTFAREKQRNQKRDINTDQLLPNYNTDTQMQRHELEKYDTKRHELESRDVPQRDMNRKHDTERNDTETNGDNS